MGESIGKRAGGSFAFCPGVTEECLFDAAIDEPCCIDSAIGAGRNKDRSRSSHSEASEGVLPLERCDIRLDLLAVFGS